MVMDRHFQRATNKTKSNSYLWDAKYPKFTIKSTLFLLLKLISTIYLPSLHFTPPLAWLVPHISKRGYAYGTRLIKRWNNLGS